MQTSVKYGYKSPQRRPVLLTARFITSMALSLPPLCTCIAVLHEISVKYCSICYYVFKTLYTMNIYTILSMYQISKDLLIALVCTVSIRHELHC